MEDAAVNGAAEQPVSRLRQSPSFENLMKTPDKRADMNMRRSISDSDIAFAASPPSVWICDLCMYENIDPTKAHCALCGTKRDQNSPSTPEDDVVTPEAAEKSSRRESLDKGNSLVSMEDAGIMVRRDTPAENGDAPDNNKENEVSTMNPRVLEKSPSSNSHSEGSENMDAVAPLPKKERPTIDSLKDTAENLSFRLQDDIDPNVSAPELNYNKSQELLGESSATLVVSNVARKQPRASDSTIQASNLGVPRLISEDIDDMDLEQMYAQQLGKEGPSQILSNQAGFEKPPPQDIQSRGYPGIPMDTTDEGQDSLSDDNEIPRNNAIFPISAGNRNEFEHDVDNPPDFLPDGNEIPRSNAIFPPNARIQEDSAKAPQSPSEDFELSDLYATGISRIENQKHFPSTRNIPMEMPPPDKIQTDFPGQQQMVSDTPSPPPLPAHTGVVDDGPPRSPGDVEDARFPSNPTYRGDVVVKKPLTMQRRLCRLVAISVAIVVVVLSILFVSKGGSEDPGSVLAGVLVTPAPSVARTAEPTAPTTAPSSGPTSTPLPTAVPSASPTAGPTSTPAPTKSPTTPAPTPEPTKAPTPAPTTGPPTASPVTVAPALSPTTPAPTRSPTRSPTPNPTKNPTRSPTPAPTPFPTKSPTPAPTKSPTPAPTPRPTKSPTPAPTRSPTSAPTEELETDFAPAQVDILGSVSGSRFGTSVSLDSDGQVLAAVGDSGLDGVRVFERGTGVWNLLSVIDVEESTVFSGSSIVSVATPDGVPCVAIASVASFRVVQYVNGVWVSRGQEAITWMSADGDDVEADASTTAVALSTDGTVLAAGFLNSIRDIIVVRVFDWRSSSQRWVQRDDPIIRAPPVGLDFLSMSLALSGDGKVVSIGDWLIFQPASNVETFEWTGNSWKTRGATLSFFWGPAQVALSEDGRRLGITNPAPEQTRIYEWDGDSVYNAVSVGIPGGASIAMNRGGLRVIVGQPSSSEVSIYDNLNGGWVNVAVSGDRGSRFGASISVSSNGNVLAVGSPLDRTAGVNAGRVVVYQ